MKFIVLYRDKNNVINKKKQVTLTPALRHANDTCGKAKMLKQTYVIRKKLKFLSVKCVMQMTLVKTN